MVNKTIQKAKQVEGISNSAVRLVSEAPREKVEYVKTPQKNQCRNSPNELKSPSDTTIYAPGLRR